MNFTFKSVLRPQFIGVVLVLIVFFGCKKKEQNIEPTGIEAQPSENLLGLYTTDTFSLVCTTTRIDSVRTDASTLNTVGSYNDPVLGKIEAATITQLRLSSENIDLGELRNVKIDSAILNLVYAGRYGTDENQTLEVYEVEQNLSSSSFYYSNSSIQYSATPIGVRMDGSTSPEAPMNDEGNLETPSIRIALDTAFARKIISTDQSNYASNVAFTNFLKGLYIKSNNTNQAEGEGSIIYLNLVDVYSRMIIYYRSADGAKNELAFLINDKSVSFNQSNIDYSGSELGNVLEKRLPNATNVYIHSFGGTMVKIESPTISSLVKDGPVLINNARLIFSANTSNDSKYPPISQMFAFGRSVDGSILFELPDKGEVHYGGAISTSGQYRIGITRYIQGILDGRIENNGLLLRELGGSGARSVIYGPSSSVKPMKLEISYTPINSETK